MRLHKTLTHNVEKLVLIDHVGENSSQLAGNAASWILDSLSKLWLSR